MESNSFHEKDGEPLWCEQCLKRNKRRKLHLYQINFEESIFLCSSNKCNFPLKEKNVQKYIRKRKFTEIGVSSSKRLKNGSDKKLSKKSRLKKTVSLSDIKNCADNYKNRNSFSSSSNDFVDDLMDFSLEALDTPAEIVSIKEKELKVPFVSNEIGSAPTAFSEDMFWDEVFSPGIPHSNIIMDVISSISSDGSIEKKSDIEEVITDFEETYPLHSTCLQSDSNISQQNYFDVPTNGDLLMQPNILSDKAEVVSVLPCTSQINNEPDEEMQQKSHPNHDEIVTLKDVATEIGENGLVIDNQSDSKDYKQNYTDILHNVNLCEKSSSDILESTEGSAISDIPTVSEEPVTETQLKTRPETNDEIVSQKETLQVNEKSSVIVARLPDSDKNEQSEMSTCLDLSKEPSSVRSIGIEEEIASEISETHDVEIEQNSKIVFSLNDNNRMYPLWRNEDALCWLDATLCLLVHNHTLKRYIKQHNGNGDCHIKKVVRTYEQAVSLANNELPIASENSTTWDNLLTLMNSVREDTFLFLQKTMHCTKGKNDSPVFSFPLLLSEKKAINDLFLMDYRWELLCAHCGKKKVQRHQKTLPTFPSVAKDFNMLNASFFRSCFYCEAPEQRLYMRFDKLPDSFTVHFTQGLPTNNISQYDFSYNGTEYKITAVVQYMMKPPHFVTWVRNVEGNLWLCCDDLQEPIAARYNDDPPVIHPSEIHIVMWERQAGNDTRIINEKETATQNYTLIDEFVDSLHNSPLQSPITISSDESDNCNGSAETCSKVKEMSTVASKESTLKPVFDVQNKALLSVEEKGNLDSQKNCNIYNSGTEGQKSNVALSFKDTQSDIVSCSVEKEGIEDLNECVHHMEQNVLECIGFSEADSDTDTAFSLVEPSENLNAAAKNVNVCTKVSDMASPIIAEPVTKDNKEPLYLSETEIEQTVEIITSSHNVNTQKEANNSVEYDVVFGANGSNLYNYSRKKVSSKGHNVELAKTSTTKELNMKKKLLISNGNMNNETEELTFQMQPCDPSLTTNTDIIELLQRSQLSDETSYSAPHFITNCVRKEQPMSHNTEICDFNFDSSCSEHYNNNETIDYTIHLPSSVQDEQIPNEMQTENNCSDESSQNSKIQQDCSNLQTSPTMLQNSEITQTNISGESASNVNVNNETEELTFQMQPCDPSLTTNTDITESLQPSKLKDETLHSVPYFTRSCARKEMHKSPNKEMSDSGFDLPHAEHHDNEMIGFPVHSSLSVPNEMPAENNHSGVLLQDSEIGQNCNKNEKINTLLQNSEETQTNINNENISNPLTFSNLQRLNNFIPNAKIGDNTFVEICESVPLDAPIANGSISYIVEVECPPAVITEQTSQIIVLNSEIQNALQQLNQACVQGINQIKNTDSETSPPNNALHIVLQQDMPVEVTAKNGDALSASTSNKTGVAKLKKKRSPSKKSLETNAKVSKSIPDLENVPVLSGSTALLLEKISRVSDVPRKRKAKPFERKLKVQDHKIDLLQESKSALDFSENIISSVKLLSSLNRTAKLGDCKTTLNRGRSK